MSKQDGVQEYLRRVSQHLEYPRSQKKVMLKAIRAFILEIPGVSVMSLDELITSIGDPEDVAYSFKEEMDIDTIKLECRRKRLVRFAVLGCLVLLVILVCVFVVDTVLYNHGNVNTSTGLSGVYSVPSDGYVGVY